ncbi:hypothetical protein CW713_03505, partial [Methanophagales archaeon]
CAREKEREGESNRKLRHNAPSYLISGNLHSLIILPRFGKNRLTAEAAWRNIYIYVCRGFHRRNDWRNGAGDMWLTIARLCPG